MVQNQISAKPASDGNIICKILLHCVVPPNSRNKLITVEGKWTLSLGQTRETFGCHMKSDQMTSLNLKAEEEANTGESNWYNIRHSLCEERVSPGFTNDQISPLYNHNTDEKCSVAGVLQDFTLIESLQVRRNLNISKVINQKPFHSQVTGAL